MNNLSIDPPKSFRSCTKVTTASAPQVFRLSKSLPRSRSRFPGQGQMASATTTAPQRQRKRRGKGEIYVSYMDLSRAI